MWGLLNGLVDGNWLPALVSLILIPALYVTLAIDVHKEYGDVVRTAAQSNEVATISEKSNLLNEVAERLALFDLEWWLVSAFAVLVVAIMSCGYLAEWSEPLVAPHHACVAGRCGATPRSSQKNTPPNTASKSRQSSQNDSGQIYQCRDKTSVYMLCIVEPSAAHSPVRITMSLYATLLGLLVGFRFAWERLKLAQALKNYYLFHYRGGGGATVELGSR